VAAHLVRPAVPSDLPMIVRGERDCIREQEPASEAGWAEAIDRNLALWIANLERTFVLVSPTGPAGYLIYELGDLRAGLTAPSGQRIGVDD
jgi:hypothetical protein